MELIENEEDKLFLESQGKKGRRTQAAWWVLIWCSYNNNKRRKKKRTNCKEDGAILNFQMRRKKLCWSVAVEVVQRMIRLNMMMKNLKCRCKHKHCYSFTKKEVANPLCQCLTLTHLLSDRAAVIIVFESISALTLLVGQQEGHLACKKWGMVEVGTG